MHLNPSQTPIIRLKKNLNQFLAYRGPKTNNFLIINKSESESMRF